MSEQRPVVLITGASSGIGYAAVMQFVASGYVAVGLARRIERLNDLAEALNAAHGTSEYFLPVACDVTDAESVNLAMKQCIDQFGRLDVLVANAGVGHRGDLLEASWSDIDTVLQTNINGVIHTIRAGVPAMSDGGHVVVVSSVAYNLVAPYASLYAASKAFASSLARSLRLEFSTRGIKVTEMLVGRVDTAFSASRLGKPGRSGSFPPAMPVDKVAVAMVKLVGSSKRSVTLRWVDRLLLIANLLIPDRVGRRALKQYR